jgi:hypothetical protein
MTRNANFKLNKTNPDLYRAASCPTPATSCKIAPLSTHPSRSPQKKNSEINLRKLKKV